MLLLIIRALYALVCAGAIAAFVTTELGLPEFVLNHRFMSFCILFAVSQAVTAVDALVRRKRIDIVTAIYFGLLSGVLLTPRIRAYICG